MLKNINDQGLYTLESILSNDVMPLILEQGIYQVDENSFIRDYYLKLKENYVFDDVVDDLVSKYDELIEEQEEMDEYRYNRRKSRARLVGGGFGIKGAAKGMLIAGTANAITGGAHRIANGIGKVASMADLEAKKSSLFNDPKTLEALCAAIYSSVYNLHMAYIELLKRYIKDYEVRIIYASEKNEACAILNNVRQHGSSINNSKELLKRALILDPYNEEIYKEIVKKFGDDRNTILDIANIFGYREILLQYKQSLLDEFIKNHKFKTKEEALNVKDEFIQLLSSIGVENHDFLMDINLKINDMELKEIYDSAVIEDEENLRYIKDKIEKHGYDTECKKDLIYRLDLALDQFYFQSSEFQEQGYKDVEQQKRDVYVKNLHINTIKKISKNLFSSCIKIAIIILIISLFKTTWISVVCMFFIVVNCLSFIRNNSDDIKNLKKLKIESEKAKERLDSFDIKY